MTHLIRYKTSNYEHENMSSIKEVAKLAGVSIATVSRYVNSPDQVHTKSARRVAQAIQATGYSPNNLARNFRIGKTQKIMVVIPSIGLPFFEPILRGIRRVADSVGYHILVMETDYNHHQYDNFSKMIMTKQTDGIILLSTLSPFQDTNLRDSDTHPPIILGLENVSPDLESFPCVRIDNKLAAREATEFLINIGHKKIAFMYGMPDANSVITKPREAGFREAMAAANICVNEDWLVDGQLCLRGGRQAARELLSKAELPTAIFCANDDMALGALHEFKQAGLRIPEDISVVGFDDITFAEISDPPLTTVAQPAQEIGERSMQRLLLAIKGDKASINTEVIPHRLVVRKSVAPPKTT